MTKILTFLAGFIGVKGLKILILSAYYTSVLSFYGFLLTSLYSFYNLVHTLINSVNNISVSDPSNILPKFWGLLHCMGFTDAFLSSLPFIVSALLFLFSKILWVYAMQVKKDLIDKALKLI
ncbi:MAG: hypothetical protein QM482_09145 [Sulfurospirillum sp.]